MVTNKCLLLKLHVKMFNLFSKTPVRRIGQDESGCDESGRAGRTPFPSRGGINSQQFSLISNFNLFMFTNILILDYFFNVSVTLYLICKHHYRKKWL